MSNETLARIYVVTMMRTSVSKVSGSCDAWIWAFSNSCITRYNGKLCRGNDSRGLSIARDNFVLSVNKVFSVNRVSPAQKLSPVSGI